MALTTILAEVDCGTEFCGRCPLEQLGRCLAFNLNLRTEFNSDGSHGYLRLGRCRVSEDKVKELKK